MSKNLRFVAEVETAQLLAELAPELGATDDAGVFRKSLAIAKVAVEQADADGLVEFRGIREEHGITVNLRA